MAVPNIVDIRTDWRTIRDDPDWIAFKEEVNGWGIELVFLTLFNVAVGGGSGGTSAATISSGINGSTLLQGMDTTLDSIDSNLAAVALAVDGVEGQLTLIEGSTEGTRLAVRGEAGTRVTLTQTINTAIPGTAIDLSVFVGASHCGDFYFNATASPGNEIEVQLEASFDGTVWFPINNAVNFTSSDTGIPFYLNRTFDFVRVNVLSQSGTGSITYTYVGKRA
jgi:hypothetical protein